MSSNNCNFKCGAATCNYVLHTLATSKNPLTLQEILKEVGIQMKREPKDIEDSVCVDLENGLLYGYVCVKRERYKLSSLNSNVISNHQRWHWLKFRTEPQYPSVRPKITRIYAGKNKPEEKVEDPKNAKDIKSDTDDVLKSSDQQMKDWLLKFP